MLELQGIVAGYGETIVLRNVDLVVPDGATVALLGPNGAGKSTLLRVASGLLRPRDGCILLDGLDVTGRPPHFLVGRGVCHVPEGRGIFGQLTVRDNLLLQAGGRRDAVARATAAFPRLAERLAQTAATLSGGEQQMLALARAYVQQPQTVLLDEVSMGLAPVLVDEIFQFLARLAGEGAALLLVEQYVTKALAMADYVMLLNKGRVAFWGEPSELDGQDLFRQYAGMA
jgi:branched-chain amino acid transport system ATP-binding protein